MNDVFNDVFKPAGQRNTTTGASLLKLNQRLQKTNHGRRSVSYRAPIIWNNNLPNSLKTIENHRLTISIATFNLF